MKHDLGIVRKLYKKLLGFYPRVFRGQLGESMEQTFSDLYHERKHQTKPDLFGFTLWMFAETSMAIAKEHILLIMQGGFMKSIVSNPKLAALTGFLLTLPFMLLNTIAGNRIEPFYTIFKINTGGGFWDHPVGHISVIVALLLLLAGGIIAILPVLQDRPAGKQNFHVVNILLAALMFGFFLLISGALVEEIYRCNILQIPNCD